MNELDREASAEHGAVPVQDLDPQLDFGVGTADVGTDRGAGVEQARDTVAARARRKASGLVSARARLARARTREKPGRALAARACFGARGRGSATDGLTRGAR